MDNLHKFLEMYSLLRWNQEEKENMKKPITSTDAETMIKNFPTNKNPGSDDFTGEFVKHLKKS